MSKTTVDILVKATDQASQVFNKLGDQMGNMKNRMQQAEQGSKALMAGVGALGAGSVIAFSNFDDAMRKVEATMGDKLGSTLAETQRNTDLLRNKAKEMGSTTAFSASEAASGMEKLALAGWDTQQVVAGIEPMLQLASAGALDLSTSADIVTDTMSAFSMEASRAQEAVDIFALTASNTNTDVTQLGEAMKYAGGEASSAGMSLEQTNAVLGYFANTGLKGSMAGTTFTAMLRDMRNNAKDGAIAIGEQNIALYDSEGNMRSLIDIMADVESATEGMTGKQRDQALSSVFQAQSLRGVNSIMEQGVDGLQELETQLSNADGTAQRMAETMEGGVGGAFRSAWSAISGLAIELGEALAPAIEIATRAFTDIVRWVTDFLSQGNNMQVVLSVLTSMFVAGMIPAIYSLVTAFIALMAPLASFLAVGALIGALAGVIIANWEVFAPYFQGIFEVVKLAVQGFKDSFITSFQNLKDGITPLWEALKQLFNTLKPVITAVGAVVGAVLGTILTIAMATFNGIVSAIAPLVEAFVWLGNMVANVVKAVVKLLTGDMKGASEAWKKATDSAIKFVQKIWEAFKNYFTGFISTIVNIFSNFGVDIKSKAQEIWSGVVDKFKDGLNKAKEAVTSGVKKSVNAILNFKSTFLNAGKGLLSAFTDGIKNGINKAKDAVKNGLNQIRSFLPFSPAKTGPLSDLDKSGESFFPTFAQGMAKRANEAVRTASKGFERINGAMTQPMASMTDLESFKFGKQHQTLTLELRVSGEVNTNGETTQVQSREISERTTGEIESIIDDLRQAIRKR